jgi:hypothetical protein
LFRQYKRISEPGAARGEAIEARRTRMLRAKHGLAQEGVVAANFGKNTS